MATANQTIGRVEQIGVGLEATAGTSVNAASWMRWQDQDFVPKAMIAEDDSALGVVDAVVGSEVTGVWSEATLNGHVSDKFIGYLLAGFYGAPSTTGSGTYTHTFTRGQAAIPKTLTFSHYSPLVSNKYAYGVVDTIKISNEAGGFVDVTAAVKARVGAAASLTPSQVAETLFTSRHTTIKMASSVAGLSGATAIKAAKIELNQEAPTDAFNPIGTYDVPEFDRGSFKVTGSLTVRYTDTSYQDNFLANTAQAMSIALSNGTSSLTFTLYQVKVREVEKSTDKDGVVTQTLSLAGEYSLSDAKSIQAVLVNGVSTYA